MRWFGEPWPTTELRAPVCEDDAYRVVVPIGKPCLACEKPIKLGDQGIVTAASQGIKGSFVLGEDIYHRTVAAYHLECFLRSILGH